MQPRIAIACLTLALLAACGKPADAPKDAQKGAAGADKAAPADKPAAAAPAVLLVSPEDVRTVGSGASGLGPVVTGSIQPERRADLRAETSAIVLQVLRENGDTVRRGDLLVRLDDTAIRDSLASADEAARAAGQAFDQAERQMQRLKTLQAQGMTSMQAFEDAEIRRNNAQSELVAARSRVATARQALQRTEVRAPFDGVVSERRVSAGDTAQIGKELVKVIDPASMRFEGSVSADRMQDVAIGRAVSFKVNGYPQTRFEGRVKRVDASADPNTRQVSLLVEFTKGDAPRVAGLYAEGRIESTGGSVPMLPEGALVRQGEAAFVWQLKDGAVRKTAVKLGERDPRSGEYPVTSGVAEGDRILRSPGSALVDGQKVEFAKSGAASAPVPQGKP